VGVCGLFVGAVLPGCGDGQGHVTGTVRFDGQAVAQGMVTFVRSEPGLVREGAIIKDGAFRARVPPGKYRIEVNAQRVVGTGLQSGFNGQPEEVVLTEELFPECYNARSELSEEIKAGARTITLDLKSRN